jgi:anti-sigma factor RsiW
MTHLGERLTDFVFGELSASDMEDARRHLDTCADCRNHVEQFDRTRSMLKMAPDVEPPRHIVFEFEKPRAIWRWLVPAAVAAAVLVAVLIATPMQIQWQNSQLTITFGAGFTPARAGLQPASTPLPAVTAPQPQPIDYDRIAQQVASSERPWLIEQFKKRDAEQMKRFEFLRGSVVYLEGQQQALEKDTVRNASTIQTLAAGMGGQ